MCSSDLAGNDNITGGDGNDSINGGAGRDTIAGGVGSDIFVFQFGQSTAAAPDSIVDFAIGADKIDFLSSTAAALPAPLAFSRAANSAATTLADVVTAVFADANGSLTGNQALAANSSALVQVTTPGIAGTYIISNDGTAGYQSATDLLINITGFSGSLPALGAIPVANFFA